MRPHLHNPQALRGVACLAVVLVHLYGLEAAFGPTTPVFREVRWFGFAGVDLFFVLSGFIITAVNRADLGRPGAVPGFLFRRAWRVYPTYWVVMAVSAGLLWATYGNRAFTPEMARSWPWWAALAPVADNNLLVGQAWTLTYEVMFYLAFGVLMLVPPRAAAAGLAGWGAAVVVGLAGPEPGSPVGKLVLSPFVLEFLGGAAVAWLAGRGVRWGWRAAPAVGVGYAAAAVAVVAATAAGPYADAMVSHRLRVLVFGPPAVLIVYGLVAAEGRWPRRVPRWLLRTGDASYSLYLAHPTVLGAAKWVGVMVPHTRLPHLLWLAGTLAATLAVGFLLHRWVERPLLAVARRRGPRPAAGPAAVVPAAAPPIRKAA